MKTVTYTKSAGKFMIKANEFQAVAQAVSKEETRYYLNGVFIEATQDGIQLAATNGHILLSAKGSNGSFGGADTEPLSVTGLIIKMDTASKSFKTRIADNYDRWMYCDLTNWTAEFLAIEGEPKEGQSYQRVGIEQFDIIDGTFPDWRRVVPETPSDYVKTALKTDIDSCVNTNDPNCEEMKRMVDSLKTHIVIGFDAELILTMSKAHKIMVQDNRAKGMEFMCEDSGSGTLVRFSNAPNLQGVIMPMRVNI